MAAHGGRLAGGRAVGRRSSSCPAARRSRSADGPTLEVGPGDLGVLAAGAETVWTVHETLRKVYFVMASLLSG